MAGAATSFGCWPVMTSCGKLAEGKLLLTALAVQIGAANQANEFADFLTALERRRRMLPCDAN